MTMMRAAVVTVAVVMPGGLVVLAAWVLARAVVVQLRRQQGPAPRRLALAIAAVRWPDVWRRTRATLRLRRLQG